MKILTQWWVCCASFGRINSLSWNRCEPYSPGGLASESQAYFCVGAGPRVVGFGSLTLKDNLWQEGYLAHVDELIVDREHRGKGAGTQLLAHLVAFARQKGCRLIELDSAFHRNDAHEFYQRHGFADRALLFSKRL